LEGDYQDLINDNNKIVGNVQKGTNFIKELFGDSSTALGKIFGSFGSLGTQAVGSLASKPTLTTSVAGLGSIYTGVRSLKNLVKTVSSFSDPKSDPVSWLVYGLQSVLEGGLTLGLAAPFLNIKNPFAKIINGKEVVQLKTIAGAALAPMLLSIFIGMAKNDSVVNRLPLIGKPLKEISASVTEGLRHISTNTGDQNGAGQAPPQLPNLGG
jgi:hypothetical protein